MTNKRIVIAVNLAIALALILANAALAVPLKKQINPHANKEKVTATATPATATPGNVKCTIWHNIAHNPHLITVSIHAVPAHLAHGDKLAENNPAACQTPPPAEEPAEGGTPQQDTADISRDTPRAKEGRPDEKAEPEDTATVQACDGESTELTGDEEQLLKLHNKVREQRGLQPVCVAQDLQNAARAHSKAVLKKDHSGQKPNDAESVDTRLKRLRNDSGASTENVARASGRRDKPQVIFKRWLERPAGQQKILGRNFREVGVGVVSGDSEKGKKTAYTVTYGPTNVNTR